MFNLTNTKKFMIAASLCLIFAAAAFAQTTAAAGKYHPIIIAIFQRGAMDGISAVIPFGDKSYYSVRPNIAVPEPKAGKTPRRRLRSIWSTSRPSISPLSDKCSTMPASPI